MGSRQGVLAAAAGRTGVSIDDLACTDCGHRGDDRRHEYDHYLGYAAEHHEDVESVCSPCHHRREKNRG